MKTTNKILIPGIMFIIIILSFHLASALVISDVLTSPSTVQPGQTVTLSFNVENNAGDEINDVTIILLLNGFTQTITGTSFQQVYAAVPLSPYQSSNIQTFDRIKEDKSENLEFELIVNSDADSGTYKIPVQMDYKIGNNKTTDVGVISVIVNAKPILSVSSENAGIVKSQVNDVTIKIVNSGLGDAKFLSVKIGAINGASIIGADSFYIGNINKDDFDTVKLSLSLNQNSQSIISIPLEITYKDSTTKEYIQAENVAVKAYTNQEAIKIGLIQKSNIGLYIGLVILVIVAYIVYRIIRGILKRRKNKNKEI